MPNRKERQLTAFRINVLNRRNNYVFTFSDINDLATEFNCYYFNIQQYNYFVKQSRKLSPKTQIELTTEIDELLMNRNNWKKEETKFILYQKYQNKEIQEQQVLKTYEEESRLNHQTPQFINYYANKKSIHEILNIINKHPPNIHTLDELYHHLYTVTHTISKIITSEKSENHTCYAARLDREIDTLKYHLKKRNYKKLRTILHKKRNSSNVAIRTAASAQIEYLRYIKRSIKKQKEISYAKAQRIRSNAKMFSFGIRYKNKQQVDNNHQYPNDQNTIEFWKSIFQNGRQVNNLEPLISEILASNEINCSSVTITLEEVKQAVRFISNWKSPGLDKIQGFWLKYIEISKNVMANLFNQWLDDPTTMPTKMMEGRTVLIYKGGETTDPKNYRPITCLNMILKVFTSVIKNRISKQLHNNPEIQQLSVNQLGCKKLSYASKEGLLESVLMQSYLNRKQKKYCELYIDVEKAYDSVNHEWLVKCLQFYQIPYKLITIITHMMENWVINLHYKTDTIGSVKLQNGILQGDSFSPLLFVLSIDWISKQLNYQIDKIQIPNGEASFTINHIYYMDDLKIITETTEQMEQANEILLRISNAIGLKINDSKSGLLVKGNQRIPPSLQSYPLVSNSNPYKYLGVELGDKVNKDHYTARVIKSIEATIDKIVTQQLSTMNIIRQINSDVISKLRYGSSVVPWRMGDLDKLDAVIRRKLYEHGIYSKLLTSARLYVSKEQLGLGLMSCRNEYTKELFRVILKYKWESDTQINELIEVTNSSTEGLWHRMIMSCRKIISEKEINDIIETRKLEEKNKISKALNDMQAKFEQHYIEKWKKSKVGFVEKVESPDVISSPLKEAWRTLNIKKDAYLQVLKMQEEAMFTGTRKANILQNPSAKYCKYCANTVCSVSHILLGCPIAKKAQISRHDIICRELYYSLYRKYRQFNNTVWPKYIPKCTYFPDQDITLLYNKEVLPRSTGNYPKRPDLYLEIGGETGYIFDVSIVKDNKVRETYSTKVGKYQQLSQKLHDEKGLKKAYIIPVIISTNGLLNKHSVQRLIDLEINIKWHPIIRELLIHQMKDIMFYLNQHIGRVEVEPGNSTNSAQLQSQHGGVSQEV